MVKSNLSQYSGEISTGSLLVPESRKIATLLINKVNNDRWCHAIYEENILQKKSPNTARKQANLIRQRLSLTKPDLWALISEGSAEIATQAVLATAIKHSRLLGDFMDRVCREHWNTFSPTLNKTDWRVYIESCAQVEPAIAVWADSTITKLRQVVFRILSESKYLNNTKSLELQAVRVTTEVQNYLQKNEESYVLRCMTITN